MGIVFCAHPVHGESHIQRYANRELTTKSLIRKLESMSIQIKFNIFAAKWCPTSYKMVPNVVLAIFEPGLYLLSLKFKALGHVTRRIC